MVNTKIKPVLPSLREKKRYLAFEVISKNKIHESERIMNTIEESVLKFLGCYGAAKAGTMVLNNKWNPEMQRGIIKVGHKHVDAVKAALLFANKADDSEIIVRSIWVSGIFNKAEKRYLKAE